MSFVRVATASDVRPGQVCVFEADGLSLAVANVDGSYYAIDNVCTHDGGPLGEGTLIGDLVECPRHGARFDVKTGQVRALPAVRPVRAYQCRVEGNDITVDVEP